MSKVFSCVATLIFFVWLLPLGAFIQPSQEKKVCGGLRAICLCAPVSQLEKSSGHARTMHLVRTGVTQESPSTSPAGGGGENFLFPTARALPHPPLTEVAFSQREFLYSLLLLKNIEHVPKV